MFPQVADIFCFISDHEAERDRYHAKKQRCNAEHPAQPTDADMLTRCAVKDENLTRSPNYQNARE